MYTHIRTWCLSGLCGVRVRIWPAPGSLIYTIIVIESVILYVCMYVCMYITQDNHASDGGVLVVWIEESTFLLMIIYSFTHTYTYIYTCIDVMLFDSYL